MPQNRQIDLRLNATANLNASASGVAQPVKMCVVELNREGWLPPGLYQGRTCSDISTGGEVIRVTSFIMTPLETRKYQHEVPYEEERWLVVAAEFQSPGVGNGLIQLKSEARKDFNPVILIDGNHMSLLNITKP
ncbi:type VI secretion system protein VasD [Enterobacillus tribolii]|uniref:Type VI secretion system protein VasD n=2 Tax=Enterobacillus tribolii TaxID=1487935 RepID=A0A370QEM5_9GAMM|nr:type VI secretion system protein VasD [Enterobacillus tribolii]